LNSSALQKVVEQDNMAYLKEIDQNSKIARVVTQLNIPTSYIPNQNNDDEEDQNPGGGGNSFLKFDRSII
jgi:hypothetical protein